MKPSTKPTRTIDQQRAEENIRRQHASDPIQERPGDTVSQQSFAAILNLLRRFKSLREDQGLTLACVAERMETNETALSQLENGKMLNPSLATLHKWAEALGQNLDIDFSEANSE